MHLKRSWLCLLVMLPLAAWPQLYHDYGFATGVDASKWIDIDDATPNFMGTWSSDLIPLGFEFWFMGQMTDVVRVHKNGVLIVGSQSRQSAFYPMPMDEPQFNTPLLMPYSTSAFWGDSSWVKYRTVGSPGDRTAVFEFKMKKQSNSASYLRWQVQLK